MGRKKKAVLTPEEQLEQLKTQLTKTEADIIVAENNLKALKKSKKELETQIKLFQLTELDNLITSKGMSVDEVKELLSK